MKNATIIDYLDLELRLSPESLKEVTAALKRYEEETSFQEVAPRIKNSFLHMNSSDFITFLGYVDPNGMSELATARFKKSAQAAFDQLLLRSTDLNSQAHYKWCLAALKSLALGRHLHPAAPTKEEGKLNG